MEEKSERQDSLESRSSESRLTQEDLSALLGGEALDTDSKVSSPLGSSTTEEKIATTGDLLSEHTKLLITLPVKITVLLGKRKIPLDSLKKMKTGDIIDLDKKVGDLLDVYVSNQLFAQAKLVAIDDYLAIQLVKIYRRKK